MSPADNQNAGTGISAPANEGAASSAPTQPIKPAPKLAIWIATGFGLGYLPIAPGTWGSLGGIVATIILARFHPRIEDYFRTRVISVDSLPWLDAIVTFFIAGVGVWAAFHAAKHFGKPDPGPVVIDEVSGQQITLLPVMTAALLSGGWKYLLLGFILFRVFDIVKPWPCKQAERWPNGWGIMADDWFAGLYAAAILWTVHRFGWLG